MSWARHSFASSLFLLTVTLAGSAATAAPQSSNGQAWAKGSPWGTALTWAEERLSACNAERAWEDAAPCRGFVAEALHRVFGLNDFVAGEGYLSMSGVAEKIRRAGSDWREIGSATSQSTLDQAQRSANDGQPVLAIYRDAGFDHIALILPGDSTASKSWKRRMPNAASIIGTGAEHSFLGAPLSYAFSSTKAEKVTLYRRAQAAAAAGDRDEIAEAAPSPEASEDAAAWDPTAAASAVAAIAPAAGASDPVPDPVPEEDGRATAVLQAEPGTDERTANRMAALGDSPTAIGAGPGLLTRQRRQLSGTWCGPANSLDRGVVRALLIDEQSKSMRWGTLQPDVPESFRVKQTLEIIGIDRDGEVLGVTVADANGASADATVFFIFSNADTLLETHRFDHVSHDVVVKGDAWQRCP